MSIFKDECKHEWEIIINEYEKSQLQKMQEKATRIKGNWGAEFCMGKKIIILQCKKCGKLNKTIEEV